MRILGNAIMVSNAGLSTGGQPNGQSGSLDVPTCYSDGIIMQIILLMQHRLAKTWVSLQRASTWKV